MVFCFVIFDELKNYALLELYKICFDISPCTKVVLCNIKLTEFRLFSLQQYTIVKSTESFTKGTYVFIQQGVLSVDPDFTIAIICRIDLRFNDSSYSNIKQQRIQYVNFWSKREKWDVKDLKRYPQRKTRRLLKAKRCYSSSKTSSMEIK